MDKKPTYEELAKRVRDLEKETLKFKRSDELLQENEKHFRLLYERAPLGYQSLDENGHFLEINQAWIDTLGYTREEVIGKSFGDFLHPDWIEHFKENFPRFKAVGEVMGVEFEMVKKDGSFIMVTFNGKIGRNEKGDFKQTHCILEDITSRKQNEEALRESEERFRSLFEQSNDAIIIHDLDDHILDANHRALEMLGYDKKQLTSIQISMLHPEGELEISKKAFKETSEKGYTRFESKFKRSDGSIVDVEISSRITDMEKGIIQGIIRDTTERNKLQARLQQAQKMESIGTLAGGIAHDFNNILQALIINTEMALVECSAGTFNPNRLKEVLKGSKRAADLVKQILAFSRQSDRELYPLPVGMIAKEALKMLRSSLPTTIEIRQKMEAKKDIVLADPTQIHQIMMNLCTNAAHAMRERGGVLEVSLRDEYLDSETLTPYHDLSSGDYLRLTVSDTGHGISTDVIERIFDPFFTTKELGEGTGMGLAVVHGIIKSLGGDISVDSVPEKGTTFVALLPMAKGKVTQKSEVITPLPMGNEHILFVDDEIVMVNAIRAMLESLGYKVTARTSSIECLEAFRAQPDNFDLVITDMTMPNMTGADLAKKIMNIRPDVPIILCTGFSELIDEKKAKAMGIRKYIMKPIVMTDMANTIREVLDN